MRFDNRIFDSDNIKNTSSATMSIDDIFEHDEQIALPMADEANQSSVKKVMRAHGTFQKRYNTTLIYYHPQHHHLYHHCCFVYKKKSSCSTFHIFIIRIFIRAETH